MSVADLIARSWAYHAAYREATKYHQGDVAIEALRAAYDARKAAHTEDPTHEDPAWVLEQAKTNSGSETHEAMMTFYREKLGE